MEDPHKVGAKKAREKTLPNQFEDRREMNKASKERKFIRSLGVIPIVIPKD